MRLRARIELLEARMGGDLDAAIERELARLRDGPEFAGTDDEDILFRVLRDQRTVHLTREQRKRVWSRFLSALTFDADTQPPKQDVGVSWQFEGAR